MTRPVPEGDSGLPIQGTDLILTLRPNRDEPLPQSVDDVEARVRPTDAETKAAYERNPDTNALTDARVALLDTISSPIRAVGLLQWSVTPTLLDGRATEDLERTFRLEFETPHLSLAHLYFEIWIEDRMVHARRQWADAGHLDVAVSNAHASAIAGALAAARTSLNLELRFFTGAATVPLAAVTARRVQIVEVEEGDSGEGQTEAQVRALIRALVLDQAETGNADPWAKSKLPADTVYAAAAMQLVSDASDIGYQTIGSAAQFNAFLGSHATSSKPRLLYFSVAITNHVFNGIRYNIVERQVRYFRPGSTVGVNFFVLPDEDAGGIPAVVQVSPGEIDKNNIPAYLRIAVHTRRNLFPAATRLRLTLFGQVYHTNYAPAQLEHTFNIAVTAALRATIANLSASGANSETQVQVVPLDAQDRISGPDTIPTYDLQVTEGGAASDDAGLTQVQQIGLLAFAPEPGVIGYDNTASLSAQMRTIELSVLNPEVLTGDIWVEGWTQGQRGLDRTKWSAGVSPLRITITELWADSAAPNLIADPGAPVEVRLRFFDAAEDGNEIERTGLNIPIVKVARATSVIVAAVDGADNAGVTNFQLPANYTDWKNLVVAMWEGEYDDIVEKSMPTAVIAAQTADREFLISRDAQAGRSVRLMWDLSERRMTRVHQMDTIIYAALTD